MPRPKIRTGDLAIRSHTCPKGCDEGFITKARVNDTSEWDSDVHPNANRVGHSPACTVCGYELSHEEADEMLASAYESAAEDAFDSYVSYMEDRDDA